MSNPVRCYKCGRIRCETCGGRVNTFLTAETGHFVGIRHDKCPDCEDGWREAGMWHITGTDPGTLCPKCEKEKEKGEAGHA